MSRNPRRPDSRGPSGLARLRRGAPPIASVVLFFFAEAALAPAMAWARPDQRGAAQTHDGKRASAAADSQGESGSASSDEAESPQPTGSQPQAATTSSNAKATSGANPNAKKKTSSEGEKKVAEPGPADLNQLLSLPGGADKSGVTSKAISLPQGSGKIQGMGESFSASLSTGIATFSVPFTLLHARGAVQPTLGLSYSSSGGFGIAGVGWDVGVPFIARQTDRGIPNYGDGAEFQPNQDHFVFNGGQELVPICVVRTGNLCAGVDETMPSWSVGSQYFRARVEGSFLRFFWSGDHRTWRVQAKSGVTMELGVPLDGSGDRSALVTNPSDSEQIYRWHLVRQYDAQGNANPAGPALLPAPNNVVVYRYFQKSGMAYLSDIFDTTPSAAADTTDTSRFAHHTRLIYEPRTDPTFSYRSGWRMDQTLRLSGVDVASKTFNGAVTDARHQVRRYHLTYAPQHASLLSSVQVEGRCTDSEASAPAELSGQPVTEMPTDPTQPGRTVEALAKVTNCPALPPMKLEYSHVREHADLPGFEGFNHELHTLQGSPPYSIDQEMTELFDINSDGLPDLLRTAAGNYGSGHGVFFNSAGGQTDSFGSATLMTVQGVLGATAGDITLRNTNLTPLDLDGDGAINLLHMPQVKTYSMYTPKLLGGAWSWVGKTITTAADQSPKINFDRDALNTKVADVNGDGLVDVVVSTGTEFQTFLSLGRLPQGSGQFGNGRLASATTSTLSTSPLRTCVPWAGSPVQLSDADTQLSDMNGDGLPDLVRIRRGDIRYWPGRGDGVWGTGERSDCTAGSLSSNGYIEMGGPEYADIEGTTLRMNDVNGDGLEDLVQVRTDAVDIWLNVDGKGWTTERHIIPGTPASPSFANRVRLLDVNGSGTPDILWADAGNYQYIDLEGGKKSFLLTHIENGLGKSTDIEYSTSAAEMLAAESLRKCDPNLDAQLLATSPWGCAWTMKMPMVAHVVKRVSDTNNLDVAGSGIVKYVTEYQYRDPLFEGRQREFRGFTRARSKRIGDANSPSDYTDSAFMLGECEDETPGDNADPCSDPSFSNPREALKGLAIFTEKYDERGVFLNTDSSSYRLRRLFVGLDGREVRQAFASAKQTVHYDTAAGAQGTATAASATGVWLQLERPSSTWKPVENQLAHPGQLATGEQLVATRNSLVPVRANAGTALITSATEIDFAGNQLVDLAYGCSSGGACAPNQPAYGFVQDETIAHVKRSSLLTSNAGGWLWRTTESFVTGSVHQGVRNHTYVSYDAFGNPETTTADLVGAGQLDRLNSAPTGSVPLPTGASAGPGLNTITQSHASYNSLAQITQESGANGRCREISYNGDGPIGGQGAYGDLVTAETIHTSGGCTGTATLVTGASYERGFGVPTIVVDMQSQPTAAKYDDFGRLSELRRPKPDSAGTSVEASVRLSYTLPSPSANYSVIHTETQDGGTSTPDAYLQAYSYLDGMGRTVVSLAEADKSSNDLGDWIVSGIYSYDAKGGVARKSLATFWDGNAALFPVSRPPAAPYSRQRYDAFGRQVQTFDLDGTVTMQSVYHALSSDIYDAADLQNGPHQGTFASERSDGHGRTIAATERAHVNGAIDVRDVRTQYLATGEPEVITRVHVDKADLPVVRWMKYDTLGHLVLNVDPHTSRNFTTARNVDDTPSANGLKAWRYAYNDAGDLVGTSDARGCGENFTYDGAGRLLTEDYVPCGQPTPYSLPVDPTLGDPTGYEVIFRYDSAPAQPFAQLSTVSRPPNYTANSAFSKGRLVAIWSRGNTQWLGYDGRGRVVQMAVLPALPVDATTHIAPNALTSRYGTRWYYRNFVFDLVDREVSASTGASVAQLLGSGSSSAVTTSYSARGTLKEVNSSYGLLVKSVTRSADGLVSDVVYGDLAKTTTHSDFDARRRLRNVQTYRGPPDLWNSPNNYSPVPAIGVNDPPSSFQLVLRDQQLTYDVVGNPTEIRDYRAAAEWPAGAKPLTKKIQYDDLYRVSRIDYQVDGGTDAWTSPFAPELAGLSDPRRANPGAHVAFDSRMLYQTFAYDWLGNTQATDDDAHGFYDRSLGTIVNDSAGGHPYQLASAGNASAYPGGPRRGSFSAIYDAAGNLTRANLERVGSCLPVGTACSARLQFYWDEVGRLSRAYRKDAAFATLPVLATEMSGGGAGTSNLDFLYDHGDERAVKTSTNASGVTVSTLYPYETLEVRGTSITSGSNPPDTTLSVDNEVPYLLAHNIRLARVVYEPAAKGEPRLTNGLNPSQHVLLELSDYLGSNDLVIDWATSELVEASTYQGYGAKESDYRPGRWKGYRDDYGFTGKEDDVEIGIVYFGKRFYSPYLNRWLSPDPLAVHRPGQADSNLYAYVKGALLRLIDPFGLEDTMSQGTPECKPCREAAEWAVRGFIATTTSVAGGASYAGAYVVAKVTGASETAALAVGAKAAVLGAALESLVPLAMMKFGKGSASPSFNTTTGPTASITAGASNVTGIQRGGGRGSAPSPKSTPAPAAPAPPKVNFDQAHDKGMVSVLSGVEPGNDNAEGGETPSFDGKNKQIDFANSSALYPVGPGQKNQVKITYTGNREGDFAAANEEAGFDKKPADYVWHHLHDFCPKTNTGTMQLVHEDWHEAYGHAGGVNQSVQANGPQGYVKEK